MRNRKLGVVALLLGVLCVGVLAAGRPGAPAPEVRGQLADKKPAPRLTPEAARAEEKAVRDAAAAFSEAFNKGDVEAMLAMWSSDGEYVSASGKTYHGKAQLRAALKKSVAATRGQKHTVQVAKVRFLKPDVAHEEGSLTIAGPDGEQEKGLYVALWLKVDGKWLLGSVRDVAETREEGKPAAFAHLRSLAWLVGDWEEKGGEATLSVRWSPGHAFLLMDWHVKRGDEVLNVHQRLGWDATNQRLRAWVYDSTGGYGDAVWEREGSKWTAHNEGQYPDGKPARSVNVWKYVNNDTLRWTATDREVDELPLPDVDATYVRKAAPKAEGR